MRNWLTGKLIRSKEQVGKPFVISDFEKSPLRFEMEAILEEYRVCQRNITFCWESQHRIINFAIALIAALAALSQFLPKNDKWLDPVFLLGSFLFSAIALMHLENDVNAVRYSLYVNRYLRPRMEELLVKVYGDYVLNENMYFHPSVWQWDQFNRRFVGSPIIGFLSFVMSSARYTLTIGSSIILLIVYAVHRDTWDLPIWEYCTLLFVVLSVMISVVASATVTFLYQKLGNEVSQFDVGDSMFD